MYDNDPIIPHIVYHNATKTVQAWLADTARHFGHHSQRQLTASQLVPAARAISEAEPSVMVPVVVFQLIDVAIHGRQMACDSFEPYTDPGHEYILQQLRTVRRVLLDTMNGLYEQHTPPEEGSSATTQAATRTKAPPATPQPEKRKRERSEDGVADRKAKKPRKKTGKPETTVSMIELSGLSLT